ncbi:MAG: Bax inhibitor-1 family protein [Gammaproteobacteria bacterium]
MGNIKRTYEGTYTSQMTKETTAVVSSFMSHVYRWMMLGILITGVVARVVAGNQAIMYALLTNKVLFFGLIIAQFAMVIGLSAVLHRLSYLSSIALYLAYSVLMGITLSVILFAYTQNSIASAFFVTAIAFGGLSIVGYFTKVNLGPIGTFCTMALFGLIGMMLLALFIPSLQGTGAQMLFSIAGIVIFSGLTAYHTQKLKYFALNANMHSEDGKKLSIQGALMLYLDFINLFLSILRLMGSRR